MMKRYLFFFLLPMAMLVHAAPVKKDVAVQKAKYFLKTRHGIDSPSLSLAMQGRQKTIGKGATVPDAFYYVFNKGDKEGYVIVSGDDSAADVLGYVDSGSFNPMDMPPNMKELLDGYAEEISWARANANATGNATPPLARQVVTPLLETSWGQDNPYNLDCYTLDGQQAVTGCVATALAQVMYYYKWPKSATTEIPTYTRNDQDYYDALPPITFDWDNMQKAYTGKETSDNPKAVAVAQLLHYCGHAVKMSYGRAGSGAAMFDCIPALTDYFGYANTAVCIQRSCYTKETWEEIIYNELHHRRPVMIQGYYGASNSGHAFVCDGYDGEGFFHINWGWEGKANGYFRLQALNPASQGSGNGMTNVGFSYRQTALVGISPTLVDERGNFQNDVPRVKVDAFELVDETNNTFDYTSGYLPSINVRYVFSASETGKYSLGYGLYQGDNLIDQHGIVSNSEFTSSYSLTYKNLSIGYVGRNLADGTYQIKCINKPEGATEWYKNDDADYVYIEVEVANGKATYTSKVVYPVLEVVDVRELFEESLMKQLRVTLRNTGLVNVNSVQYLLINDTIKSRENVYIEAGKEEYVDFFLSYRNLAPVNLKLASSITSNIIYEDANFQFAKTSSQQYPEVLAKEIRYIDAVNHKMYGKVAEAAFTLRNNTDTDYHGCIDFNIHKARDDGRWSILSTTEDVDVKAGETKVATVRYKKLDYGDKIELTAYCAGKSVSASGSYIVSPGIIEWDGNGAVNAMPLDETVTISGDAAAVSFEGLSLSGNTIIPNDNPNTIYYIDADADTPASLTGKNVVKGFKADAIHLSEGHSCFVPYTFEVVGTADYSFSPVRTCDGNSGWQTVTLPFAVTSAKADGHAVEWNRHELDDGKDFWVREYGYVEDATAHFHNASEWRPCEPYVIGVPASLKNASWLLSATGVNVFKSEVKAMVGSGYRFVGATGNQQVENAYMLNNAGDAFVKTSLANILPGDAYFLAMEVENLPERILIARNGKMGDVNGDGLVNVTDVSIIVDYILNKPNSVFILANADVNGDGDISIADVTLVVNIILNL